MGMGMKRGADSGEIGTPQKQARKQLGYELRLLIPCRAVGSIIGKRGSRITKLRTENNNCKIRILDCQGPERLVLITADDQDTTLNVLKQIVSLIEGDKKRSFGPEDFEFEVRLLIHQSQVGCIIGKAGCNIKDLRKNSNALIKVYSDCCPRSTDRVIAFSGSEEVVVAAVKLILDKISEVPIQGLNEPYNAYNFDEMYSYQYGGWGAGNAPGPDRGPGRFGRKMRMGPPRPRRCFNSGSSGSRHCIDYNHGGQGQGARVNVGGGRDDYDHTQDYDDERQVDQVSIPKEYAGSIIGQGGTTIQKIRVESGAIIKLEEPLPGATDRIITISGNPTQIRNAQYLLQQACLMGMPVGIINSLTL